MFKRNPTLLIKPKSSYGDLAIGPIARVIRRLTVIGNRVYFAAVSPALEKFAAACIEISVSAPTFVPEAQFRAV